MRGEGAGDWVGGALEGEGDVYESGDGLDGGGLLGVVGEVALAGLVFGVPFEDVELVYKKHVSIVDVEREVVQGGQTCGSPPVCAVWSLGCWAGAA